MELKYPIYSYPVDAAPEEVGYNSEKLMVLDELMAELIDNGSVQCMNYLMARHGKVFAWKSMGRMSAYEDKGDFMPDSIRKIQSVTKIFTATAIMQLIESGKLHLHKPVHTIISEFNNRYHEKITLFHLLTHTSGIAADPGYWGEPYATWWTKDANADNWIQTILSGPLQSEPGKSWNYSSRSFALLGEIITRVSGVPYEDYVTKHILEPLGLSESFYCYQPDKATKTCFVNKEEEEWQTKPRAGRVSAWSGGGGLFSNLHDLWKFAQMILNKGSFNGREILSRKMVEAMTRNHLINIPSFHWGDQMPVKQFGLGWEYNKDPMLSPGNLSHDGAGRSSLWIDPAEDFIFVYFQPTTKDWSADAMLCPRTIAWSGLK